MLKLLGALLMVGGGGALGLGAAGTLARRAADLDSWARALALAERELSFRLPATAELLETLSQGAEEPASAVCALARQGLDRLGEEPFSAIWTWAAKAHPGALAEEDVSLVARWGTSLGRWGAEDQRRAALELRRALEDRALRVREELRRMGRVYTTAGLTAGAFVALLLL